MRMKMVAAIFGVVALGVNLVFADEVCPINWTLCVERPGETNLVRLSEQRVSVVGDTRTYDALTVDGRTLAVSVVLTRRRDAIGADEWTGFIVNREPNTVLSQLRGRAAAVKVVRGETALYYPSGIGQRVRNFPTKDAPLVRLHGHEIAWANVPPPSQEEVLTGLKDGWPWRSLGDGTFVFVTASEYPSCSMQMQFYAVSGKDSVFYFLSRDLQLTPKKGAFFFDANHDELTCSVVMPLHVPSGGTFAIPPVVFHKREGADWRFAARQYRVWWDTCHKMATICDADRDMVGFFEFILEQQNCRMIQYPYTEFAKLGDVVLAHGLRHIEFHGWHRGGHDTNYPVYDADERMGGEAALRRGLSDLQKRGLRIAAYFNGQLIDIGEDASGTQNTTSWRRQYGDACALVTKDGRPFPEHWNKFKDTDGHYFYRACLSAPDWYDQMLRVSRQAKGYGFNGLFFDQMGTSEPKHCFSARHNHRPGDLVWCRDRPLFFRNLLAEIRATTDPDTPLLAEGWNDSINESTIICQGNGNPVESELILRRFDDQAIIEPFPELIFYTFPEVIYTDRFFSPYATRTRANATAATNLRIDIESRYVPDRPYCESGIRPATNAYDLMFHAPKDQLAGYWTEDWAKNRDYLRTVCDFRRANRDLLLRGRFVATDGFACAGGRKIVANRWVGADGQSGILVWNADSEPAAVTVSSEGRLVSVTEPEAGQVDPAAPIPANTLRLFRFRPWENDPSKSVECRARDGLPNVLAKLRAGKTVRIAYLGGSITHGNPGWRTMTRDWFAARFPNARVEEIVAAICGTGSDFGAFRLADDVLSKKPDLLFVEFRVNGSGGFDYASVESIVRQTWAANPQTDICFVYTLEERMLPALSEGRQPSFGKAMETICDYYGIPSIDYGPEIVRRLSEGRIVFKPAANVPADVFVFTKDGVHPKREGHEIYRDVVVRAMEASIFPASGEAARPHALPPPYAKDGWQTCSLVPSARVLAGPAWHPVDVEKNAVYGATREPKRTHGMLRGGQWTDREGTSITLRWAGSTLGFSDIPQGDTEPMVLEVSVDGGAPYEVTRARKAPHLSASFWYVPVRKWGEHTATVTLKRLPKGQRWIVGQFLVTGTLKGGDKAK